MSKSCKHADRTHLLKHTFQDAKLSLSLRENTHMDLTFEVSNLTKTVRNETPTLLSSSFEAVRSI